MFYRSSSTYTYIYSSILFQRIRVTFYVYKIIKDESLIDANNALYQRNNKGDLCYRQY